MDKFINPLYLRLLDKYQYLLQERVENFTSFLMNT